MKKPGRKSKTDLALAKVTATERPGPVPGLSDEQKFEWVRIVNACPAERFGAELLPLLEAYCRHRIAQRRVGELIVEEEKNSEFTVDVYDKLLKMQERESRTLASLSVRLGFASTAHKGAYGKNASNSSNPWE